jgi:hypothetical protein
MKSLADRHAERAQRKADNLAEASRDGLNKVAGDVGAALSAVAVARDAMAGLSDENRKLVADAFAEELSSDSRSLADDENGEIAQAGIGVVNTDYVPIERAQEAGVNADLGWSLPNPSFDPKAGNLNGAAVEAVAPTVAESAKDAKAREAMTPAPKAATAPAAAPVAS